jgi:predicted MPP superfamily phosphohydrolase
VFLWGAFVTANRLCVRTIDLQVARLPAEFAGYRILQWSDLHIGAFTPPSRLARWIERTRGISFDLLVITGDLVTSGTRFHDAVVSGIGQLASQDGVVVVPGNHDFFDGGTPLFASLEARGVRVLRNEHFQIKRGPATLSIAGVDDAWTCRTDVALALRGCEGNCTVLLAHDPALFEKAALMGADVVLAGHTHGGQLAMPWLVRYVNIARPLNRHTYGVYRKAKSALVVHGGMGCTGIPIRIGVPPELLLIRLWPMKDSVETSD